MKVGIIGLGYVGLPLVIQFARSGAQVLGFDLDDKKVDALNKGRVISNISLLMTCRPKSEPERSKQLRTALGQKSLMQY